MVYVDIFISLFLVYGFVKGLYKGFISEVASVIGLTLGIYLATIFSKDLSDYLLSTGVFELEEEYLVILSHIILFTLTIILVILLGNITTKLAKLVALGIFNKILGSIFGLVKNVLILIIVIFLFNLANNSLKGIKQDKLDTSIYYKPLNELSKPISTNILRETYSQKGNEEW